MFYVIKTTTTTTSFYVASSRLTVIRLLIGLSGQSFIVLFCRMTVRKRILGTFIHYILYYVITLIVVCDAGCSFNFY